jgi:hypothetical protein
VLRVEAICGGRIFRTLAEVLPQCLSGRNEERVYDCPRSVSA